MWTEKRIAPVAGHSEEQLLEWANKAIGHHSLKGWTARVSDATGEVCFERRCERNRNFYANSAKQWSKIATKFNRLLSGTKLIRNRKPKPVVLAASPAFTVSEHDYVCSACGCETPKNKPRCEICGEQNDNYAVKFTSRQREILRSLLATADVNEIDFRELQEITNKL